MLKIAIIIIRIIKISLIIMILITIIKIKILLFVIIITQLHNRSWRYPKTHQTYWQIQGNGNGVDWRSNISPRRRESGLVFILEFRILQSI